MLKSTTFSRSGFLPMEEMIRSTLPACSAGMRAGDVTVTMLSLTPICLAISSAVATSEPWGLRLASMKP